TCNLLYEEETGRARFIDFEMIHDPSLSPATRHADDLMAFLMDIVGIASRRTWLGICKAFLQAYGDPEVLLEVRSRMAVPTGPAWIWWKIRANFAAERKLAQRLIRLARALDQEILPAAGVATGRRTQNRRPSN